MRKLIIFLVTGMLWCNVGFAKDTHEYGESICVLYTSHDFLSHVKSCTGTGNAIVNKHHSMYDWYFDKLQTKHKITKKPKKKKPKKQTEPGKLFAVGSGTGFFINRKGNIISNNHVIDKCQAVKLHYKGDALPVKILSTDRTNDLSLMKSKVIPDDIFSIDTYDASLLEDIYVAGYPFGKRISSSVKVTKGVVSSLSGIGNNYSNMQIDAALQPGNSGGPIINTKGNVVGVAVMKLNYKAILKDYDTIPENTNFGIKSSTVQQFIRANNISSSSPNQREMSTKDLGLKIQKATVYLDCWMTEEHYYTVKETKTSLFKKVNFD